jgi:hypothetical protein
MLMVLIRWSFWQNCEQFRGAWLAVHELWIYAMVFLSKLQNNDTFGESEK